MPRKPRSDSVLKNLPLPKREMITAWLVDEGCSQQEVITRIETELHLKVGKTAVSEFYRDECLPIRYQRSSRSAQSIQELMESAPGAFDSATIKAITQRVFDLATDPESAPGEIATLATILGESRKLQIKEQELKLKQSQGDERLRLQSESLNARIRELEQKIAMQQFDAAKAVLAHAAEIRLVMADKADTAAKVARVQAILWGADALPAATEERSAQ